VRERSWRALPHASASLGEPQKSVGDDGLRETEGAFASGWWRTSGVAVGGAAVAGEPRWLRAAVARKRKRQR
jgi:hypothetical protein